MFLSTADLTPMSRESMRGLRAKREELCRQEEEARRRAHVANVVREVYQRATMLASVTNRTQYTYSIKGAEAEVAQEIVEGLRPLFPECTVSCVTQGEYENITIDWGY